MLNPELEALARADYAEHKYDRLAERTRQEIRTFMRTGRLVHPQGGFLALNPMQISTWFTRSGSTVRLPNKYTFSESSSARAIELKVKEGRVNTDRGRRNVLSMRTAVYGKYPGSVMHERIFFIPSYPPIYSVSFQLEGQEEPLLPGSSVASEEQLRIFTELALLGEKVAKQLRKR